MKAAKVIIYQSSAEYNLVCPYCGASSLNGMRFHYAGGNTGVICPDCDHEYILPDVVWRYE